MTTADYVVVVDKCHAMRNNSVEEYSADASTIVGVQTVSRWVNCGNGIIARGYGAELSFSSSNFFLNFITFPACFPACTLWANWHLLATCVLCSLMRAINFQEVRYVIILVNCSHWTKLPHRQYLKNVRWKLEATLHTCSESRSPPVMYSARRCLILYCIRYVFV